MKISAKGINHASLRADEPLQKFWSVLRSTLPQSGVNKGFRAVNGEVYTYSQQKQCLPYFYCKRYVNDDGIFTSTLQLTLCPVPKLFLCIQTDVPELGPDFVKSFKVEEILFYTIRQAIVYFRQKHCDSNNCDTLNQIMSKTDSYSLENINRAIDYHQFWIMRYSTYMKTILSCRLRQNPELGIILANTGDKKLVNADPRDSIGGCGDSPRTTRWCSEAYLRGRNMIGDVYATLRREHNGMAEGEISPL